MATSLKAAAQENIELFERVAIRTRAMAQALTPTFAACGLEDNPCVRVYAQSDSVDVWVCPTPDMPWPCSAFAQRFADTTKLVGRREFNDLCGIFQVTFELPNPTDSDDKISVHFRWASDDQYRIEESKQPSTLVVKRAVHISGGQEFAGGIVSPA